MDGDKGAASNAQSMVPLTRAEVRLVIFCAMATMFLSVLDQTIVATSLPSIAADLGNFSLISWVITSYLLTSSCVTPVVGKFSDLYGRRRVLRGCLMVFIVSSVICAMAPNLLILIIGRLFQGLGGGALATMAQTVVADIASPRERGRYTAHMAVTWGSGSALGPLLGGLLTQYLGWPFIFWINLPFGLGALLIADRALAKLPISHRRASINYAGILLLSGATIAFLLVLSLGGKRLEWDSWQIVGLGVAAIALGAIFVWNQSISAEPILSPHFLRDGAVRGPILINFVMYMGFLTIISLTPIFFQVGLQVSVGRSGMLMIPLMIGMTISSYSSGAYIKRFGRYKPPPFVGLPLAGSMALVTAFCAGRTSALPISLALFGFGAGMGLIMTSCQIAAQNAVDPRDLGAVNGSITFARVLGGSLGISIASAFVLGVAANALPHTGDAIDIETLTRHVLSAETRHAISGAFGYVFGGVSALAFIGLAIFSRVEERELRRDSRAAVVPAPE
jgi:EmrB/QacA subfamily drug resistance transporter